MIRDIYDIWFYLQMQIEPDLELLEQRLKKPAYPPQVKPTDHFTGKAPSEFYDFLPLHAAKLTDNDIEQELSDYLPREDITGLSMIFRAALAKLR